MGWTYEQAVHYIEEVPKFTTKNKPEHTREMLARLGHPEEAFRVIHVAGTNGKGSVCAFLESIFRAGGFRTGLFTSPHLVTLNERFQINRENCSDEAFLRAFETVMETVRGMQADDLPHPTYFELLFAVGMILFREAGIDLLVMETGLGGRLDATNAVAHPIACVITSISLDHTEYLGTTIPEIAGEKAGIIKEGVPVIYDATSREAAAVMERTAREKHAPAYPFYPEMAQITEHGDTGLSYVLNNRLFDYASVTVPFLADYQVANSALALMCARVADPEKRIPEKTMLRAIADTRWAGRMECILPGVVLDGAHNEDGIEQFLKTVARVQQTHPVSLLFAAVVEKNYPEMIRRLSTEVSFASIVVTQIEGYRKVDAEEFAALFRQHTQTKVTAIPSLREAFSYALSQKKQDEILFCAGSLYMVGEIEATLQGQTVQAH